MANLNRCCDALLVSAKAFSFFPAHSLQHLVANVVTVQAVLRGLLIIPVESQQLFIQLYFCYTWTSIIKKKRVTQQGRNQ